MKISPRRAVSTILAAALLLASVPPSAQAQVVRVVTAQSGSMPVSPVSGSAASAALAPALQIGAASLAGGLSAASAAPSPVVGAPVSAALAAAPSAAASAAPALTAAARAAASKESPERPDAPKAAAAPAGKTTWRQRLSAALGRAPSAPKTPAAENAGAEAAKADADAAFDGSAEKTGEAPSVQARGVASRLSGLKSAVASGVNAQARLVAANRAKRVDAFGGPLSEPMTFKQRVGYGLRQGLNLVGAGALMTAVLSPVLELFPWPQYLSDASLNAFGRVALLAKFGPNEIVGGLAQSPAAFLAVDLPMAVTMEEISFRLLSFGGVFLVLAAIKPFARWISGMISSLPDAAGVVGGATRFLRFGEWISHFAFPIAATLSAFGFAVAHLAAWGFSPYVLLSNFVLGLLLARIAYKSRSLTSPVLAHLVFNLVSMGGILIAMTVSPYAGAAFSLLAALTGVASLLYAYLMARKERAFRLKNAAKALAVVAVLGAGLSMWNVVHPGVGLAGRDSAQVSETVRLVQDAESAPSTAPAPLATTAPEAASVAPVESREAMVARVKGSVVNVIVRMPQGMATGSGFILTPEGVFVTNGHVVGAKQPGDVIEARVPGVQGVIKAKVLAVNHDKDLAIVQLAPRSDGKPWPVVKLAAQAPREGEDVTATGYPRGLPFTVTAGVVSGLDGRGNMYVRHMQTDAAINPGNSGGPLFNSRGEVVGVNTQIYTQSGGSEGLGFSIMAPEVAHVMAQYAHTGNIATASLGIIANLSDPMAPEAGLEIEYIRQGSAAEKAGLRRGDLLIGVGESFIEEGGQQAAGHVAAVLSKLMPGQTVTVTVLRGDEPVEVELTVDAKVTQAPSH